MDSNDISDWDDELLLGEFLKNWCQDLEEALYNAAIDDPDLHEQKITFCDEFCERFSDSGDLMIENMKRDAAESCFHLCQIDEGDRRFEELAEDIPDSQWVYIGWGDMYSPSMFPDEVEDVDKARRHYKQALDVTDPQDR